MLNAANQAQDSITQGTYSTIQQTNQKADQITTYTKTETDSAITAAIGGGGGGYTDAQIDGLVSGITTGATSFDAVNLLTGEWKIQPSATAFAIKNDVSGTSVDVLTISNQGLQVGDTSVMGRLTANGLTSTGTTYQTGGLGMAISNTGNLAVGNMGLGIGNNIPVGQISCHELEVRNVAGVQVAQLESTGVVTGLALNVSSNALVGGHLQSGNITSSGSI
jgi:hypothetical protein